jgi:hypothetical protein
LPGSPAHLFSRFFDVASARPLTNSERSAVSSWLDPELAELFFAQADTDQRHGYHAALHVIAAGEKGAEVLQAALLHDVGKRHAGLGVVGRSLASLLIIFGLPLSESMRAYRDHGLLAARELGGLGVPSLAIDFAMHHHGDRPPTIDPQTWALLVAADEPPKTLSSVRLQITFGS